MPRLAPRPLSVLLPRLLVLLLAVTCLTGCGGCRQKSAAELAIEARKKAEADAEKEKKKEEKKDPLEIAPAIPLLSESLVSTDDEASLRLTKPGHWTTTVQRMRANEDNFEGRTTLTAVDEKGRPLPLPHTQFSLSSSRPALLAKGRVKRVQNEILLPPDAKEPRVRSTLIGGVEDSRVNEWSLMPSNQYFVLVLAREPGRYAFLKVSDAVRAPNENDSGVSSPHYRVVLADGNKPLPLPANVLTLTSVAYIVWDEVNLDRLDAGQQEALVDWIHWGGRLIVNGPDSLATLRGSFLNAYLPADPGKSISVTADGVAPLNAYWARRFDRTAKPPAPLAVTRPWSGVELLPREGAKPLPGAGNLFVERAVGSGSIVVSAIQLAERDLVNWPGFDGFLNGALLRRPPRVFRVEADGAWVGLQTLWAAPGWEARTRDAHFTTPLRWFARDFATKANAEDVPIAAPQSAAPSGWAGYGTPIVETKLVVDRPGGLGAWNEFSPVSDAAREAIIEAAGVRVPGAGFVVACLAIYLIVLVPLNWMLFHALGRVEWAWIAAPVIALAGTFAVVRQAQLDIGFVRSQTEIALLEMQGDYPRGHLSRYTALYSSLSTVYDIELEDDSAVATPFPTGPDAQQQRGLFGLVASPVEFEKYDHPRLRNVPVSSATTQLVHSEQMVPLAGPLRLAAPSTNPNVLQLDNRTGVDLSDAVVIRRNPPARGSSKATFQSCWIGRLDNGSSPLLSWKPVTPAQNDLLYAAERVQAAKDDPHKRLGVDGLLKLAFRFPATDPLYARREEYRLIARLDEPLPGSTTTPAASQVTGSTVVLAHLRCELPPPMDPDVNSPADVLGNRPRNAYDEELPAEAAVDPSADGSATN